jgi:hypothetical protein
VDQGRIFHVHGGSKTLCHGHGGSWKVDQGRIFHLRWVKSQNGFFHGHDASGEMLSLSRWIRAGFFTFTVGQNRFCHGHGASGKMLSLSRCIRARFFTFTGKQNNLNDSIIIIIYTPEYEVCIRKKYKYSE